MNNEFTLIVDVRAIKKSQPANVQAGQVMGDFNQGSDCISDTVCRTVWITIFRHSNTPTTGFSDNFACSSAIIEHPPFARQRQETDCESTCHRGLASSLLAYCCFWGALEPMAPCKVGHQHVLLTKPKTFAVSVYYLELTSCAKLDGGKIC